MMRSGVAMTYYIYRQIWVHRRNHGIRGPTPYLRNGIRIDANSMRLVMT